LQRARLLGRESLPDHVSATVTYRTQHCFNVVRIGDQNDRRARAGNSPPQPVDKQLRFGVGLVRPAHLGADDRAEHHPDGEAGWTAEDSDAGAGGEALGGSPLGDMEGLVYVDIMAREGAAQDQVAVAVMLDQTDLAGPWRVAAGPIARSNERLGGRAPTFKAHQRQIKSHPAESTASLMSKKIRLHRSVRKGELTRRTSEVTRYVDQHVAHSDAKPRPGDATFADLDAAIDLIGDMFRRYGNLLTASMCI
jgi:hypothetical protein